MNALATAAADAVRLRTASAPPEVRDDVGLVIVDGARGRIEATRSPALARWLAPGDVIVLNDAATLPAALPGRDAAGAPLEVRLCHHRGGLRWRAVVFGAGSWRQRTELRPPPPALAPGDRVVVAGVPAHIEGVATLSARLVDLRFATPIADDPAAATTTMWAAIYRAGRPVQYAHLAAPLSLWAVENLYADRPWAFEMPSAGRPLSWRRLGELRRRGVIVARLTHAAGLSATGDPALDAALPLPERYDVPADTVATVERARAGGGRVIAVGTSVVRALESAGRSGALMAGAGITDLRIGPAHPLRLVDGLLTGLHEPGESHFALLQAFTSRDLLDRALRVASTRGFRSHELGDLALVLRRGEPG